MRRYIDWSWSVLLAYWPYRFVIKSSNYHNILNVISWDSEFCPLLASEIPWNLLSWSLTFNKIVIFVLMSWAKFRIPGNDRVSTLLFGQFSEKYPLVYSNSPRCTRRIHQNIFHRITQIKGYLIYYFLGLDIWPKITKQR